MKKFETDITKIVLENCGDRDDIADDVINYIETELAYPQIVEAMKHLELLTPGGSEFHNDPKRCYLFVKDLIDGQHKKILSLLKK